MCVITTKKLGDVSKLCCDGVEIVMKLVYLPHGRGKFITVNSVRIIVTDSWLLLWSLSRSYDVQPLSTPL